METTTNLGLRKPGYDDDVDIEDANYNMDRIDTEIGIMKSLATTGGTANAYTATIPGLDSLGTLMRISMKFHIASTGASTLNINGLGAKDIIKPGGGSPNLKAGVYTLVYDGVNFQLQGEGGDYGTATDEDVRQGKTIGTDGGIIEGTATDHGPVSATTTDITTENGTYIIPKGFHSGLRTIRAKISGLVAGVIKAGTTIGGVLGTFTSDANAVAGNILSGKTAYVNGNKITGTISSKGASTFTPGTSAQTIAAGQYLSGTQTISAVAGLSAANVKNGTVVGGVTGTYKGVGTAGVAQVLTGYTFSNPSLSGASGTMINRGAVTSTLSTQGGSYTIPAGYHSGTGKVTASFGNLSAGNIKSGVNIGGVVGTYTQSLRTTTGTVTSASTSKTEVIASGILGSSIVCSMSGLKRSFSMATIPRGGSKELINVSSTYAEIFFRTNGNIEVTSYTNITVSSDRIITSTFVWVA